jgi:tetratricopeptide (TPR) repeat protein
MNVQCLTIMPSSSQPVDPVSEVLAMPEIPTLPEVREFNTVDAVVEGLATSAMASGDYHAVIRHCSHLVQARPENYEAWLNLGVARARVGDYEDAIFCFHQATRIRAHQALPWLNLGIVRQLTGDDEGAIEAYEHALRIDPDQRDALWNLALLSAERDVMVHSTHGDCRFRPGRQRPPGLLLDSAGEPGDTESLFLRLANVDPSWDGVWLRLGLARLRRDDWEGSAHAFRECLDRQPSNQDALLNLAVVHYRMGLLDEAQAGFEQVLRAVPQSVDALRGLAAVCAEIGDWERALSIRRKLVEMRQPFPELTFNLAWLLDCQGRDQDAIRLYCDVLKENPRCAEALLNLGHVLERLDRHPEAVECWKRAMALDSSLLREYFQPRQ